MMNRMQRALTICASTLALISVCLAGVYVRFGGSWPIESKTAVASTADEGTSDTAAEPEETTVSEADTAMSGTGGETTEITTEILTEDKAEPTPSETETSSSPEALMISETAISPEPTPEKEPEYTGLQKAFIGRLAIDVEKASTVYVREEPTTDSRIISALSPSDVVRYLGMEGDFYRIQLKDYTGYVHQDYVLTDLACYESRKDYVGYAVMSPVTDVMLYAGMDDSKPPIHASEKADEFHLAGIETGWYRVSFKYYTFTELYIKQDEVIIYPVFLRYGDTPTLKDWELEHLNSVDLSANILRAEEIKEERQKELAAYEANDARIASEEAAAKAEEEARIAREKEEARKRAAEAEAKKQEEARNAQAQANETGQPVLLGTDFTITKYCHCTKCCGKWGNDDPNYVAHGASGMDLTPGVSIAVDPNLIPYGSHVLINGKEYIAMDTTDHFYWGSHWCDIYCATHDETEIHGLRQGVSVYLLPNP